MTHLSPDARALLDAARHADDPTTTDRARVRSDVFLRIAQGAAVGGGLGVASAAAASGGTAAGTLSSGMLFKTIVFALAVLAASGASMSGHGHAEAAPTAAIVEDAAEEPTPPVAAAPEAVAVASEPVAVPEARWAPPLEVPPADAPPPVQVAPAAPSAKVALAPKTAAPAAEHADDLDALLQETAMITAARVAVREGRTADAMTILDQHAREHPNGQLGRERTAVRILALCQSGDSARGRAEAAPFLASAGNTPLAARIREACGL
jgi:hypothetical protein